MSRGSPEKEDISGMKKHSADRAAACRATTLARGVVMARESRACRRRRAIVGICLYVEKAPHGRWKIHLVHARDYLRKAKLEILQMWYWTRRKSAYIHAR